MRIVFILKITSVISQADVSRNGLFVGLWTEAEVSLGFIVACSLCLPKLIKVKAKHFRSRMSQDSAPWSSFTSKSRKSWLWDSSRDHSRHGSKASRRMKQSKDERPLYYEERVELQRLAQAELKPDLNRYDIYALPSTAANSDYSMRLSSQYKYAGSIDSPRSSFEIGHIEIATIARPVRSRTISVRTQEVPMCLDQTEVMENEWEEERRMLQQFESLYTLNVDEACRLSA
jgi:hypothetical protein